MMILSKRSGVLMIIFAVIIIIVQCYYLPTVSVLFIVADDKITNVVLSCGLGFKARPGHCDQSNTNGQYNDNSCVTV